MNRNTILIAAAILVATTAGAFAGARFSAGGADSIGNGLGGVLQLGAGSSGQVMLARRRGFGRGTSRVLQTFDVNGDGTVSQAEVLEARANRLLNFDADGDGQLTLEEYQLLWLDTMRERMVDRFQSHDDDGNAVVTANEFTAAYVNLIARLDRNDDGVFNDADAAVQRDRNANNHDQRRQRPHRFRARGL